MSTEVFRGKHFVVEQESIRRRDGGTFLAEWVSRADGVRIIARSSEGQLLLSDEYRHELGARDLRLPGGKVDKGRSPSAAAEAELQEETGLRAGHWSTSSGRPRHSRRSAIGFTTSKRAASSTTRVEHDEDEDIETVWVTVAEAVQLALEGKIGEDLSALQILRLAWREGHLCRP